MLACANVKIIGGVINVTNVYSQRNEPQIKCAFTKATFLLRTVLVPLALTHGVATSVNGVNEILNHARPAAN